MHPTTEACRRGFRSTSGFVQHKNVVHASHAEPRTRPRQHPYIPEQHNHQSDDSSSSTSGSGEDAQADPESDIIPEGSYYIHHPVLDGKW